jgi:hypothetical protein
MQASSGGCCQSMTHDQACIKQIKILMLPEGAAVQSMTQALSILLLINTNAEYECYNIHVHVHVHACTHVAKKNLKSYQLRADQLR